jgi:hypothetical protein
MHTYPADERQISDIERGRSCEAVVSLPPGESPKAGEVVLFALSISRAGQPVSYVNGGDSVLVSLIDVALLCAADPDSVRASYRLRWEPLGQILPANAGRVRKARRARITA